jgi:hypothetical protein
VRLTRVSRAQVLAGEPGATRRVLTSGSWKQLPDSVKCELLGPDHYDLTAMPDVSVQPDVPMFMDCVVAVDGNPRHAAASWAQTAGACLLEFLDRQGRYAEHDGPDDGRRRPRRGAPRPSTAGAEPGRA